MRAGNFFYLAIVGLMLVVFVFYALSETDCFGAMVQIMVWQS